MKKILKFQDFLREEYAMVGVAPEGNVTGMGDVTPPSSNSAGSGDTWPSLSEPFSLIPLKKKKKKKRRARKTS